MLCNYTHKKFMQILVKPQGKSFDERNENRDQSWLMVYDVTNFVADFLTDDVKDSPKTQKSKYLASNYKENIFS